MNFSVKKTLLGFITIWYIIMLIAIGVNSVGKLEMDQEDYYLLLFPLFIAPIQLLGLIVWIKVGEIVGGFWVYVSKDRLKLLHK